VRALSTLAEKEVVEEYLDCVSHEQDWNPRYDIAPSLPVPVIRQHPKELVRQLSLMRWGLFPSWAKDSSAAASMINARSKTAATKPAFRDALKSRRCMIPADGFYEWMRTGKSKQPYCFEVNEGELFAFAGIGDRWRDASGKWVKTVRSFDPGHDPKPALRCPADAVLSGEHAD
jgi:putative SOS response-associated peptidase YedK